MSKITALYRKPLAMAICFLMVFGVTLGFTAERAKAASLSIYAINNNTTSSYNTVYVEILPSNNETISNASGTLYYSYGSSSEKQLYSDSFSNNLLTFNLTNLVSYQDYTCYAQVTYYSTIDNTVTKNTRNCTFTTNSGGGGGSGGNVNATIGTSSSISLERYGSNNVNASVTANVYGSYTDYTYGFVYSTTESTPTLNSYNCSDQTAEYWGNSIYATLYLTSSSNYYIRAYIKDNKTNEVLYSSGAGKQYTNNYGSPVVQSNTIQRHSTNNGYITANGYIDSTGSSTVTEYGFVYSTTVEYPEVGKSGCTTEIVGTSAYSGTSFGQDFIPNAGTNAASVNYYVRAYAKNNNGTGYGDVRYVTNIATVSLTVTLGTVTANSSGTATASISVSGISASNIYEWGVVYVEGSNGNPLRSNSAHAYTPATTGGNTTNSTVEIKGLKPSTTYTIRAYARTKNGSYQHSQSKTFTTTVPMTAEVYSPIEVTYQGATLSGYVSSQGNSNLIKEKGFVYSRSNNMPTLSDFSVKHSNSSEGNYNCDVALLASSTAYYVRAYVTTTSGDTVYSDTATSFTTKANTAVVEVSYKDQYGNFVGSQTLNLAISQRITVNSLTVPVGYVMEEANWTYTVTGNDTISVYLRDTTGNQNIPQQTTAPVNPQTPDYNQPSYTNQPEEAFMTGIGNYMFGPDNPGTNIEVAAMLFSLLADPNVTYPMVRAFPDVNYANALTANIVNFVSSQGYMIGNDMGLFRPNDTITRAEIAVIICEVEDYMSTYYGPMPIPSAYADTDGHWAQGYIYLAAIGGIFRGYEDFTFRPDNKVTRAELATIFYNLFERSGNPLGYMDFVDVSRDHWAYYFIMNAAIPQQ